MFVGWVYDHDFNYGHTNQGHYALYIAQWVYSTQSTCVWVDGYGHYGGC